jgi:mannose-6-phosphate isomerase-like protein (cupin superfamily)
MKCEPNEHHLSPDWALRQLPGDEGVAWCVLFEHGSLEIEVYAPQGTDPQLPHTRDEVYVIISGTGWFINGSERSRFAPGDLLFVPALAVHRFEDFSNDFSTWVMFYGPEGGEERVSQPG